MMSLSDDKQADVIDAFNTTSRYLDNILNFNNVYFDNMVSQIYYSELQLYEANTSDTEAAFLDLHLSISNDIVSTKNMINVTTLIFWMVIFFALHPMESISLNSLVLLEHHSYVADFNTRNKLYCSETFLNKAIGIINFAKPFLNFTDDTILCTINLAIVLYV